MYGKDFIYDINLPRVKHVALTGFLSKKWHRFHAYLKHIVYNCDVSPYLGALPPELRRRVDRKNIPQVTSDFRNMLEDFLIQNAYEIYSMDKDRVYYIPQIGDLFGTQCVLEAKGVNVYGVNPWGGASGFVLKMSFPEINAHYALKLFYKDRPEWIDYDHGVWFEVATALAANKAEPKDNNPMYMASFIYEKYMLSAWAGDEDGIKERENKNSIFCTTPKESESRNLRSGRRIDWGETYRTNYGALTYSGRKLIRQIMALDAKAVKKTLDKKSDGLTKKELKHAVELAGLLAYYDDNLPVQQFMKQNSLGR